jgi:hypothetical protein
MLNSRIVISLAVKLGSAPVALGSRFMMFRGLGI